MKFVLLSVLLTFSAFSEDRQAQRVISLASQVERLTSVKAYDLSQDQIRDLTLTLRDAMKILRGFDDRRDRQPACSDDPRFQSVFTELKNFAYNPSGLDYSSQGAVDFALKITAENSCEKSLVLLENIKVLRTFAYSPSGLDMSSSAAANFALEKAYVLCPGVDFVAQYKRDYDFAYSPSGLDMSSSDAKKYAYNKMESTTFSCRL